MSFFLLLLPRLAILLLNGTKWTKSLCIGSSSTIRAVGGTVIEKEVGVFEFAFVIGNVGEGEREGIIVAVTLVKGEGPEFVEFKEEILEEVSWFDIFLSNPTGKVISSELAVLRKAGGFNEEDKNWNELFLFDTSLRLRKNFRAASPILNLF